MRAVVQRVSQAEVSVKGRAAVMNVSLVNDGPVTLLLDSRKEF